MMLLSLSVVALCCFVTLCDCQLVVNVKNNGGDVYRENINANTSQDTVSLEFRKADGTVVTQFIDGKNEIQIFKVVILPEEERGQTQVQTICFVSRFAKNEFISSDAMSKLRQKNPSAIRHPEETRPDELFTMDLALQVPASSVISLHVVELCSDAMETTFMPDSDLQLVSQILSRDYQILRSVVDKTPMESTASCQQVSNLTQPCICHYDICIGWYPCGLKYCRGKDSANRVVSYRCGIKTCSRCRRFEFLAARKALCIWDEPEFTFDSEPVPETGVSSTQTAWNVSLKAPAESLHESPEKGALLPQIGIAADKLGAGPDNLHVVAMEGPVVRVEQKVEGAKEEAVPKVRKNPNEKTKVSGKSTQLDDDEDEE